MNRDRSRQFPEELELLAGRVLGDLSPDEIQGVDGLGQQLRVELTSLELAAASAYLAFEARNPDPDHPLPASLAERIRGEAFWYLGNSNHLPSDLRANERLRTGLSVEVTDVPVSINAKRDQTSRGLSERLAWLVCAAATLLCIGLWVRQTNRQAKTSIPSMARAQLLQDATDLLTIQWSEGPNPFETAVAGDVVWSNDRQMGYMRFVGAPINQPHEWQYQLWIVDPTRDDEPVDGGVFDIVSTEEVVIPIHAKLPVAQPVAFAITVEKPGGVVVSTQENLPLLAAVTN
jgi:hypothetical protein